MSTRKRFSAEQIILRAIELGIELSVHNGEISLSAPRGTIKPNILSVIREYKSELLIALSPVCNACLNEGRETPATHDAGDFWLCAQHAIAAPEQLVKSNPVVSTIYRLFNIAEIHIDPPGYTLEDRVRELNEQARREAQTRAQRRSRVKAS